jgi:hypothetical protein
VVAPVVLVELLRGGLLQDVLGRRVEDEEERLLAELADFGLRAGGMDVVAGGEGELWLDGR